MLKIKSILLLGLLLVIFAGCGVTPSAEFEGAPVDAPAGVTRDDESAPTLAAEPVGHIVVADGQLSSPYPSLKLGFAGGISGEVLTFTVKPGDSVAAGSVLARLNDTNLLLAREDARRALERVELDEQRAQQQWESDVADAQLALESAERSHSAARLQSSSTSVEEALTSLEHAKQVEIDAKKAYDTPLFGEWTPDDVHEDQYHSWQDAIRQREFSEMRLADAQDARGSQYLDIQAREGDVAKAQRALDALQVGLAPSYVRAVEDAQLQLDKAEQSLANAELLAPWDAIVLSIDVAPSATVGASTPVLTLLSVEAGLRFVSLNLSEQHVASLQVGQPASITLRTFPEQPLAGVLEAVIPQEASSAADNGARFSVHVRLLPSDLSLLPGLTGRAEIFTE